MYFDSGIDPDGPKNPASALTVVAVAAIFGTLAMALLLAKIYWGGLVFGACGLLMGGFSFARAFTAEGRLRIVLTAVVAAALILSVIGFMLGLRGALRVVRWHCTGADTTSAVSSPSHRRWRGTSTWRTRSACPTGTVSPARCAGGAATSPT